jgi:hypothetical protein
LAAAMLLFDVALVDAFYKIRQRPQPIGAENVGPPLSGAIFPVSYILA